MWDLHDANGWWVLGMGLMMAVFWVPLLLVLIWALREFAWRSRGTEPRSDPPPAELDARELARRSYARGDIDREHYLQVMEDLEQTEAGRASSRG